MNDDIRANDRRTRRCPMLGHEVAFSYCRQPASPLPCRKVFDCWWEAFDVEAFVRGHFADEDIEKILAPRQDKTVSLMQLIEQANSARKDPKDRR